MPLGTPKKFTSQTKGREFLYLSHSRLLVTLRATQDINAKAEFNLLKLTPNSIFESKTWTKSFVLHLSSARKLLKWWITCSCCRPIIWPKTCYTERQLCEFSHLPKIQNSQFKNQSHSFNHNTKHTGQNSYLNEGGCPSPLNFCKFCKQLWKYHVPRHHSTWGKKKLHVN